jgi:transcriptional regulator with PAS, ATPase and Fis domain
LELTTIKQSAEQIATTISKIMEVDVVVVDNQLERIADTFKYPHKQIDIRTNSIVGSIIVTGRHLVIEDKRYSDACQSCPDLQTCDMESIIGVPIIYKDKVIGAVALIVPPQRMLNFKNNFDHVLEFLKKMAELIAGELKVKESCQLLRQLHGEREVLVNSVHEAIAIIKEDGCISYCNDIFSSCFSDQEPILNKPINEILKQDFVENYLRTREDFVDKLFYYERADKGFDFLCSAHKIEIADSYYGAIFVLRDINQVGSHMNQVQTGLEDDSLDSLFCTSQKMVNARLKVQNIIDTGESVLLVGTDKRRLRSLAHQIHLYSTSNKRNFFDINCDCDKRIVELEMLGKENYQLSKIRLAHKGTLCIHSIDQLPFYLQRKLDEFLANRVLGDIYRDFEIDVRIIATTTQNLERLVEKGLFMESLYKHISSNCILLPNITDDPEDTRFLLNKSFKFYKEKHNRQNLQIDEEVLTTLCKYPWSEDIHQLEKMVEYLIIHAQNNQITMESLHNLPMRLKKAELYKPIDKYNKERIQELIRLGKSRDEIAQILGISRATLFRWLKKYNIN